MAEALLLSDSERQSPRISLENLLHLLVVCSEKAACIARTFRTQGELFETLVEEKSEIKKNQKMVQDFKTLADVLIQETIKRDIKRKFPILSDKVRGEEQNTFQNTMGESIKVELNDSVEDTTDLLCKVLNGNLAIAESLAQIVHSDHMTVSVDYTSHHTIKGGRLGIWIDPIDSTSEYIQAKENKVDEHGIDLCGLKCVCVLIGVYDSKAGVPVIGVINQPFYKETNDASKWKSNIYWGIRIGPEKVTSASLHSTPTMRRKIIVTSIFEDKHLLSLMETRYTVVHASGAGYKCLAVAKHSADLYVLSLPNTHVWDTCAPHAILAAQGGGIVKFFGVLRDTRKGNQYFQLENRTLPGDKVCRNEEGIIAYKCLSDLDEFCDFLKGHDYYSRLYENHRLKN